MLRRGLLGGLGGFGAMAWTSRGFAQAGAPITIVMPYPPGGIGDFLARLIAKKLSETLGVSTLVENKPGANGAIGAAVVAGAKPDGHTLLCMPASTLTTNPWIMKSLGYDPIKDFTPLSRMLEFPNVLMVTPGFPAKSVQDLIDIARRKPGSVNYASVGMGSSTHLQAEMFKRATGIDIVNITYKGSAPALQDLVAGQVEMMFDNLPSAFPLVKAGKLRALAVTGAERSPVLPDVPTVAATVPGFVELTWWAVLGPAGLPADVAAKLSQALAKIGREPDFVAALAERGGVVVANGPDELRTLIRKETDKTGALIKDLGITAQ
ncbi:MAG: tripartite tricarboxylate transporter substrate binding protein [Proteobacteria bacterium]|nr:tripartite tricarboxylate transporter substrate binding protein [Pseudomonadota bacterium]